MGNDVIHQVDLARLVLNDPRFPNSVYCTGGRYLYSDRRDIPDYQVATFDYEKFVLTVQAGEFTPYMSKTSLEIRHGKGFPEWKQNATKIAIFGTDGLMYVGRMGGGWQVYGKDGKIVAQEEGLFPLRSHLGNYIDCIRSRNQPNGNIVEGHKSTTLIHLANLSYRTGKKQLNFSGEYEIVSNNKMARDLSHGLYRKGFEIPEEV